MSPTIRLFICLLTLLVAAPAFAERPNVLLIVGDDMAYGDYGFMGSKTVETPELDRLAREGTTFTRGYVPTSLCRASLMSIVTGLYPHQHGVVGNDPPKGEDRAKMLWAIRQHPTLPKLLAPQGYYCYQTGKWWEGAATEGGFSAGMTHGDPAKGGRHGDIGLKIGRDTLAPIGEAIAKSKADGKPFFIWYAPMLPHSPHDPPAELLEKYKPKTDSIHVARYWANCERFDRTIGKLRTMLAEAGVADNTLIVYLHDNGWIQEPTNPQFAPRSKRSPNEGGIRTPIIFHLPGKIAAKLDEQTLASSLDVLPTLCAAAGIWPLKEQPGLNLLDDSLEVLAKRDAVFGEIYAHDVASFEHPEQGLQQRWCIVEHWKLIHDEKTGASELYDLAADPREAHNVAKTQSEIVSRLQKRIDDWWNGKKVAVAGDFR